MATQTESENKFVGRAKIAMVIATIIIIVCLFTVPLWKSNVAQTGGLSKFFGGFFFVIAFLAILEEKFVRNRYSETVFYVGWLLSIGAGLFLSMGGGL